jgi:fermentation-respiration switch protein FrsA (DUF1100 family)
VARSRWVAPVMAAAVVGLVIGALAAVVLAQRSLIYHPTQAVPDPVAVGLPQASSLPVTASDGTRLRSWYVPARGPTVGAVLVLHGNGGNRAHRAPLAAALADRGLATLLLDYRGYGGSAGTPTEEGLLLDAQAGIAALRERSGVASDRIVVFGESLGTGITVRLAAEAEVGALVLRSPFPSLAAVGARLYPWLPVRLVLRDRFDTLSHIDAVDAPVLVIAGGADRLIPPELSRQVADAADAELVTVAGVDHNDRALLDGAELLGAVTAFLRERAGIPVRDVRSGT